MEKQWQLGDEGLTEAFESLSPDEQKRLSDEMNQRLDASNAQLQLKAEELSKRNEALCALLLRRHQFLNRLKSLRDELRAEDEAFRLESERLLAA